MANSDAPQILLEQGIEALGLRLPAGAVEQLLAYQAVLTRWNATYNLTAVREPAQIIVRHLLDSLAVLPYVQGSNLVDLGTGAGLPGLVLAIVAPDRETLLVDSNGKKIRFLREAMRVLRLRNVRAVQQRVEHVEGRYDCVTARAFASLTDMLSWGGHLLCEGGSWLAMKGHVDASELAGLPASFELRAIHELKVPGLQATRHLLEISQRRLPI